MDHFWSLFQIVILQVIFFTILGWILLACARDAKRRGKSPVLVCLLILISFPLGVVLWLLFRPELLNGGGTTFRLQDHRVQ